MKQFIDAIFDFWFGIDTRPDAGRNETVRTFHDDNEGAAALSYISILYYLWKLKLNDSDLVVDIGGGSGRILCCLARRNIRKAVGIEVVPDHFERAQRNLARLRKRTAEADVILGDAALVELEAATVYILFNPFGPTTMRQVLSKIKGRAHSLGLDTRSIRFAYINPYHESVFFDAGWLQRYKVVKPPGSQTWASFWHGK